MDIAAVASIVGILGVLFVVLFGGRNALDIFLSWKGRRREVESGETSIGIADYKARLEISHRRLRFGDPTTSGSISPTGDESDGISLVDIYTPLSVATEFGLAEPKNVRPVQLRVPVQEALSSPEAHRAVVLGDPGAGKSTMVDYLVGDALRDETGPLPVHIRLSEITADNTYGMWAGVLEVHGGDDVNPDHWTELDEALKADGGLLLFDGLDEVAADAVPRALADIIAAGQTYPKAQVVVTCRSYDYYLTSPERQLPSEFTKWRLLPFTLDDMLSYVDKWYEALGALKFISAADERKRNLQDSLRNSPELEALAATPLLLALMALVHTTEGELPSARSVLYHKAVAHLLADTPQWRARFVTETIRLEEMFTIATEVAFEVQSREAESTAGKRFVGLTIREMDDIVSSDLSRRGLDDQDHFRFRNAVDARVRRIIQSNGLLVEQSAGHFHFAHRSLQEFLAGAYLLNGADYPLGLQLAGQPNWHEPFVLMAGYGSKEARSLFFLTKFIEDLAAGTSKSLEGPLLAGEMLAEIGKDTLRSHRFERLVDREGAEEVPLWQRIIENLNSALVGPLDVPTRISVLQVLGRLGDPRFVDEHGQPTSLVDRLVSLPSIRLTIGDDGRVRPRAKSELVETAPARVVSIAPIKASPFLVTNLEFRRFLESDGYSTDRWWLPDGLRWLSGDPEFATKLEASTVAWIDRDYKAELDMGRFRMEDVVSDAAAMSRPRLEPFYWRNARYNESNQPVVGINWWEANAYCAWMTEELQGKGRIGAGEQVRIPNEWEWERLARGRNDHRAFPWGSDEDTTDRAHTRFDGLDLDAATPVGAFPLGCTADGLFDVAGNVWEWTSSRAAPMSVHHDRNRHQVGEVTDVVVRGGSWFSDVDGAVRCGYRGIDLPQNVYYDVGMRVIVTAKTGGS